MRPFFFLSRAVTPWLSSSSCTCVFSLFQREVERKGRRDEIRLLMGIGVNRLTGWKSRESQLGDQEDELAWCLYWAMS